MNTTQDNFGYVDRAYDEALIEEPMTKDTKKEILLVSGAVGITLIVFMLLGTGIALGARQLYASGALPQTFNVGCILQIIYSLCAVLLPFFLCYLAIQKIQKRTDYIPMNKPNSWNWFGMAVCIGFLSLIVLNFATSYFSLFLENFGISFGTSDIESPSNVSGYIWMVVGDAIVPALCEEFAFRGVVLQSFRKYGDSMAIGISALLFAILHGNMNQAPFAFLLGLVIGRLVIATGSIWTGIGIHLLNNTYAIVLTSINHHATGLTLVAASIIINTVGIAAGLIAGIWLIGYYKALSPKHLYKPGGNFPAAQRTYRRQAWLYTLISLPMTASVIWLLKTLIDTIQLK